MKNIFKYKLLLLSLLIVSSCMEDDQDYPAANKPTATVSVSNTDIAEGSGATTVTITLDRAINKASDFKIDVLSSGTAQLSDFTEGPASLDEYELGPAGYQITIPATQTSVSFDITADIDLLVEGTEVANFRVTQGQEGSSVVKDGAFNFSVNVANYASNELGARLDWQGDVTYSFFNGDINDGVDEEEELTEDLCDHLDLDLLLFPGGSYLAGTADCPEVLLDGGPVLTDGTYQIAVDLWALDLSEDPISEFDLPFRLTLAKVGKFSAKVEYSSIYNTNSSQSSAGGNGLVLAATIDVVGGLWTVYDRDGNLVASE